MKASDIMFEFSSEIRVKILNIIKAEPQRLSDISKKLDITTAEVSRHLDRLSRSKIVAKGEGQKYSITLYGGQLFLGHFLYSFLSDNDEYFLKHDLAAIPTPLRALLPLYKAEFLRGTINNCDIIYNQSAEAKDFMHVMARDVMPLVSETVAKQAKQGIKIKKIYPDGVKVPDEYFSHDNIEVRTMKDVPFMLGITDNFGALALSDGKSIDYDYLLSSEDDVFMEWLGMVFEYFWKRGKPYKK
jgi:predicted transcriptional regulator